MLNVSNEFLTKIKEPSRSVKASIGFGDLVFINKILNGNFSNGVNSWTSQGSTLSATNNILSMTGSGTYTYTGVAQSIGLHLANRKYYVSLKARVTNSNASNITAFMNSNIIDRTIGNISSPVMNTWYNISNVITPVADISVFNIYHYYTDIPTSTGKTMEMKDVIFIDLTTIYGAGNEPSKVYLDGLISKIGWFDGTKKIPSKFVDDRTLTNLFPTGNFASTSGWLSGGCTISASNNTLTMTGAGTNTYCYTGKSSLNYPANHKYYARIKMKPNERCNRLFLYANSGTAGFSFYSNTSITNGNWYTMSGIITASATITNIYARSYYATTTDATGATTDVQEFSVIDLTEMYGAGNEPTVDYMDNLIATHGWFASKTLDSSETGDYSVIQNFDIEQSFGNNDLPTIGATVAGKLQLSLINDTRLPQVMVGVPIRPYVSIETSSGVYEWVALGEYYADYSDVTKSKMTTKLETFDIMTEYGTTRYDSTLTFPATIQQVMTELQSNYNIVFASQSLPAYNIEVKPVDTTVRQVISMIASLCTRNAVINEIGQVEFRFLNASGFSLDANNYSDFKLTSDSIVKISQLQLSNGDNVLAVGDDTGYALEFDNPNITSEAELQAVYDMAFPLQYYPYSMKVQGMPHLEIGDTITFTRVDGTVYTLPILKHKLRFTGGLASEFIANAPKQDTTNISVTTGSNVTDAIKKSYESLMVAINHATDLITGALGGNVITITDANGYPTDLVIADNMDINQAQKIWRWNIGGLGFSSTGFNGTYTTAITQDGAIVADFITTGTLIADLIKAGVLKSKDNTSWIDMENGTFNLGSGRLVWDGTNFTINYNGTDLASALDGKVDESDPNYVGIKTFFKFGSDKLTIGRTGMPQQIVVDNVSVQFLDYANTSEIQLTALTGSGSAVTATFSAQQTAPFLVGNYVELKDCVPTVYNGVWLVTSCTTTQCVMTSTASGTVTTLGKIRYGFKADSKAVAWINGQKMYISDVQVTNSLQVGNHQIVKDATSGSTLIKYVG